VGASDDDIRRAYRRAALRFHPDRTGQQDAQEFMEIRSAYERLVGQCAQDGEEGGEVGVTVVPDVSYSDRRHVLAFHRVPPEPVAAPYTERRHERRFRPRPAVERRIVPEPLSAQAAAGPVAPDFSHAGLVHEGLRPPRHDDDINLDLVVNGDEAEAGTRVEISLPVRRACPACHGAMTGHLLGCGRCDGVGQVADLHRLRVVVPAGAQDGEFVSVPAREVGLQGGHVNVRVRVRD
jgi:DnaJ-class molecular chaperone